LNPAKCYLCLRSTLLPVCPVCTIAMRHQGLRNAAFFGETPRSLDFSQFLVIHGKFCHLDRSMRANVLMRSGEICFCLVVRLLRSARAFSLLL
jgi:hypothetical protein